MQMTLAYRTGEADNTLRDLNINKEMLVEYSKLIAIHDDTIVNRFLSVMMNTLCYHLVSYT